MALLVLSRSSAFVQHLERVLEERISFKPDLVVPDHVDAEVLLVHESSFKNLLMSWLDTVSSETQTFIAIASDEPNVQDMLEYSHRGVRAYFNSYMVAEYYLQMLRLLKNGQSWFPPRLMAEAFDLARNAASHRHQDGPYESLTKREREVAQAVAEGLTNKQVAHQFGITERTVKTHLTHIFNKLKVKDRVSLVIFMNQYRSNKTTKSLK